MDEDTAYAWASRALVALNRNPPKGWVAQGITMISQEIDYFNPKTKRHKTYSFVETENGLRVLGGKNGPVDVPYEV